MGKFILFPKNELTFFNQGKKYYFNNHYKKAIECFNEAMKIKILKEECIKYLIDCHIELHHYDEVYKMIENEFVDKNINEEYLIKKYLYTMMLEKQYLEVHEIIQIYQQDCTISQDLYHYLEDLQIIVKQKLYDEKNFNHQIKEYLTSSRFEDHIKIILNLSKLDVNKYQDEIKEFLNNTNVDCFIRYNLLKYLFEHQLVGEMDYTNYYSQRTLITNDNFFDLFNDERYLQPPKDVIANIKKENIVAKELIDNIWLDFCVKYYPFLISDLNLGCAVLHVLLLKTMSIDYNPDEICQMYDTKVEGLFSYFEM